MSEYQLPTIKRISFNFPQPTSKARNQREDLIEQIADRCRCRSEKERQTLTKRIAIWANSIKADTTDLHALLRKADDPSIRNYGGFVNYSIKIKRCA